MSWQEVVAVVGGFTALLVAVAAVLGQVVALRRAIDGRMDDLLLETKNAASKLGELAGRDFERIAAASSDHPSALRPTPSDTPGAPPLPS